MINKKGNILISLLLIVIVLAIVIGGGIFGYYYIKMKKNKIIPVEESLKVEQVNFKVRFIDAINQSNVSGVEYCVYDSGFNKLNCQVSDNSFTEFGITKYEGDAYFFVIMGKDGEYLSRMDIKDFPSGIKEITKIYEITPVCNPKITANGIIDSEMNNLTISLACENGRLSKPMICADWSSGFVYVRPKGHVAVCNVPTNTPFFNGYWRNFTEYKLNSSNNRYSIDWLSDNQYQCGDNDEDRYICESISDKDCYFKSPEPPQRLNKISDNCFSGGKSLVSWDGDNNFSSIDISIKTFGLRKEDFIDFYIVDSTCLYMKESLTAAYCQRERENERGEDIGGKDIKFTLKPGEYNNQILN